MEQSAAGPYAAVKQCPDLRLSTTKLMQSLQFAKGFVSSTGESNGLSSLLASVEVSTEMQARASAVSQTSKLTPVSIYRTHWVVLGKRWMRLST